MAQYRIGYTTYIVVEADDEQEAREMTCTPEAEDRLLTNLQESYIEEVDEEE